MKKRNLDIVVISDVNLGHPNCCADALKVYLSSIHPKQLILNGDFIYKPSISKRTLLPNEWSIIHKLNQMAANGTEIIYIIGDKDCSKYEIQRLLGRSIVIKQELVTHINGKKAWILHGDTLFPKTTFTKLLFSMNLWLPMRNLLKWINHSRKSVSDLTTKGINELSNKAQIGFEKYLVQYALRRNVRYIICGHTYQPEKKVLETSKGICTYLNSGDWISHLTALEYSFKRWKVYQYSLDKLRPFFGDEDIKTLEYNELIQRLNATTK